MFVISAPYTVSGPGAKPRRRVFSVTVRGKDELQQVIRPARFGTQPAQLKAAERSPAHRRPGGLEVGIEVAG